MPTDTVPQSVPLIDPALAVQDRVQDRLAYLDWLRFLVVLSLAPFHGAISFTGIGVVYVYDTPLLPAILSGRLVYDAGPWGMRLFVVFFDNWFMHLLFFVSGVGVSGALRKRSPGAFVAERASRLLLPAGVCTVTVIAAQAWLRELWLGRFSGGFLAFYPRFFNGIHDAINSTGNFEWGHLWFLVYLFVFSVLTLPLFIRIRQQRRSSPLTASAARLASGAWILLPALWIGLLEAAFRPGWPGYQDLVNDWANFTVYISFFVFGFLAGEERRVLEAAQRRWMLALAMGLALFTLRMEIYQLVSVPPGYSAANMAVQFVRGLAAFCLVLGMIGLGRRFLSRDGPALAWARDVSFPLYVLHYLPLSATTLLLLGTRLPVWARFGIAVLASWTGVAVFTELARFLPPVARFLSIRRTVRAPASR